jgi:hypothetical protein
MGWFGKAKNEGDPYLGAGPAEPADLEKLVLRLLELFEQQTPVIEDMGKNVVVRAPVLVIREGKLVQPVTVLPTPMLARFWTDDGLDVRGDTLLPRMVSTLASGCLNAPEVAKLALEDTEALYITPGSPFAPWPEADRRFRVCSLVLADVVRKLAADFPPSEMVASYGFRDPKDLDALRGALDAMRAQEADWIANALS